MTSSFQHSFCTLTFDSDLRRQGFSDWVVGNSFAFYKGQGPAPAKSVLFLGSPGTVGQADNPVRIQPESIGFPELMAVSSDKMLYREGNDTVRLMVYAPRMHGAVTLLLQLNGTELTRVQVGLDDNGLGLFELRDPVAGDYTVELGDAKTSFTVAAYKLAPLTGRLEQVRIEGRKGSETLHFSARLETYGAPLTGGVKVTLVDMGSHPPSHKATLALEADATGHLEGSLALSGSGPFALQVQATRDAMKTATLPLPGSRKEEREELELSVWGKRRLARLVPFQGATEHRGLWIGAGSENKSTPLYLEEEAGKAWVRFRADIEAWRVVVVDVHHGSFQELSGGPAEAGTKVNLPVTGTWSLVLVGLSYLGHCWEGRAAIVLPGKTMQVRAPKVAGPGEEVMVELQGAPGASAFLLVKDQRLQVADTPGSTTAASLRRQLEHGLRRVTDGTCTQTLEDILPQPPPPMPPGGMLLESGAGFFMDDLPVPSAAMSLPSAAPLMMEDMDPAEEEAPAREQPREGPTRSSFPDVMLARLVRLDGEGKASVPVKLGDGMGTLAVEAFAVTREDWAVASAELLVSKEVFGELVLPRFVAAGDHAEGVLHVRVASGLATVTVLREGQPVRLFCTNESGERLTLAAPGQVVRFPAQAGRYQAEVRGESLVDRSEGKVEEPGKLLWLQQALRMLAPGEVVDLDQEPGGLALKVLPSLDKAFDRMVGGLRAYEHACCEQTSAVLLAATAAWLTAQDEDMKRSAAAHMRACIAREESMHLPGKGFKSYPHSPPEVSGYSPGATFNLLQMDMVKAFPLDAELARSVDRCLEMARDAAKAHRIDPAPVKPQSAREAYGRSSKFPEDRERMAAFIRERIEPWQNQSKAILKFKAPAMLPGAYPNNPAMIRSETAFGAATLIEAGRQHLPHGLALANTVLGAIQENGSLYSTLDSVAAITLLAALRNARVAIGPQGRIRVDGQELTLAEALSRSSSRRVESVEGHVQVQVNRLVEEDYTALDDGMKAQVSLMHKGRKSSHLVPGDSVELVISLQSQYQEGDLVHVFLPDALSWVHGGGQVKRFSMDMKGESELRVPLAATGLTLDSNGGPGRQHFAVCIRNMYDEKRGKGFGQIPVSVHRLTASGPSGLAQRVFKGIKDLIG
ncbi:alpha-2-macroglobulin family protein [Hyalangium rubrum]|uniref:Alpha-2-macroglobulin family protein n=1 Tax=Hyalangium rubrum TaxID=3103134 RepID=A0ABU5GV22_9BACT|nr:alpha-2-macroglobulin family protein [Hyalangium sp. s54d21]MDY7225020.1 alpha-2-macroglobulin family protein [Hyalangium sp. s54d21]